MAMRTMKTMTREQFEQLPQVRVFSPAGPCLTFYRLLRRNAKSVTVAFWNGDHVATDYKPPSWVHTEPCTSCTDHEKTMYPRGYMD